MDNTRSEPHLGLYQKKKVSLQTYNQARELSPVPKRDLKQFNMQLSDQSDKNLSQQLAKRKQT